MFIVNKYGGDTNTIVTTISTTIVRTTQTTAESITTTAETTASTFEYTSSTPEATTSFPITTTPYTNPNLPPLTVTELSTTFDIKFVANKAVDGTLNSYALTEPFDSDPHLMLRFDDSYKIEGGTISYGSDNPTQYQPLKIYVIDKDDKLKLCAQTLKHFSTGWENFLCDGGVIRGIGLHVKVEEKFLILIREIELIFRPH